MEQIHIWMRDLLHGVESFAASPNGAWELAVLSFAESSFFPIPPDVLLIALCLGKPEPAFWFATVCGVASVLGAMAGYGIGFWGGRPLLKRLFRADRVRAVESYLRPLQRLGHRDRRPHGDTLQGVHTVS